MTSNNAPDVVLELRHEQATFLLENVLANKRLCFALIMSIADEKISIEEKQQKAAKFDAINKQYTELMLALRKAGAKEKEE